MASGSSYEEVKNAEIPLPCPGILLMFISVGHTSIYAFSSFSETIKIEKI
jgi:hypothetical protein